MASNHGYSLAKSAVPLTPSFSVNSLKEMASKMGLTPDIHDTLETFDDCKKILEKKALELNLLQAMSMESDDENIVDLREQMFVVAKLLYSDIIEDITQEEMDSRPFVSGINVYIDDIKSDMSIDGIINKIRSYMDKRSKYRESLNKIKKRLKENMDL